MQTPLGIGGVTHFRQRTSVLAVFFAVVVCVLAGTWLCPRLAALGDDDASPSATSIIGKAIEFHGGLKALGRDLALVRSEESEMLVEGDKIAVKCEWEYQPPDKRAFQALVKIGSLQLRILQGMVGDKGWVKVGPALAVDLSPEQVLGMSWEHDNHLKSVQVLAVAQSGYTMTAPRAVRIGDRDAWQITFTNKKHAKSVTAFFDKTSGQVLGDEAERVLPTMQLDQTRQRKMRFRVLYKSFLNVEGMRMPEAMSISCDGKPAVEVRKASVRVVDSIDPKLFTKPS